MTSNKAEIYAELLQQAEAIIQDENDLVANLANLSALIYWQLADVSWAGFYLLKANELVLGPFQGKPACVRIPLGRGVCGVAAAQKQTQIVEDVHQFDGHIACDSASNSEIVLPILKNNEIFAVLDLDSEQLSRFDENDKQGLSKLVELIETKLL